MKRPLSMTGFGRGEVAGANRTWVVEFKSVNHRYLDIKIKGPWKYGALEERIRGEIAAFHSRGHIDLYLNVNGADEEEVRLEANLPLAGEYFRCLSEIGRELNLDTKPDLAMIADFRDVIKPREEDEQVDLDEVWGYVRQALRAALEEALTMRENEGRALRDDLAARLAAFADTVAEIEAVLPAMIRTREESLKERLAKLLNGVDLDPMRLAQEVAVIVDKADITEELVRLKSHVRQFEDFLGLDEPVGRRLDFLLQEFLREVNTMASKISNAETAHLTVSLKNELEKMREQVQNLE